MRIENLFHSAVIVVFLATLPTARGGDHEYGTGDGWGNCWTTGEQRSGEPKPAEKNWQRKWADDSEVLQPFTPEDPDFYATDAFTTRAIDYLDERALPHKGALAALPTVNPDNPRKLNSYVARLIEKTLADID